MSESTSSKAVHLLYAVSALVSAGAAVYTAYFTVGFIRSAQASVERIGNSFGEGRVAIELKLTPDIAQAIASSAAAGTPAPRTASATARKDLPGKP